MKSLNYRILLCEEPEGGYTVTVPTLPGCVTFGETIDEAILMAKDAISLYIESLLAHREKILASIYFLEMYCSNFKLDDKRLENESNLF